MLIINKITQNKGFGHRKCPKLVAGSGSCSSSAVPSGGLWKCHIAECCSSLLSDGVSLPAGVVFIIGATNPQGSALPPSSPCPSCDLRLVKTPFVSTRVWRCECGVFTCVSSLPSESCGSVNGTSKILTVNSHVLHDGKVHTAALH